MDSFDEAVDSVREAIDRGDNVAVVSDPYGGRNAVADEAEEYTLGVERVSFSSVAEADGYEMSFGGQVCVVEGCRYLYTRRVDGFAPVKSFLQTVVESDATFVTTWNSYAWSYAAQATEVDDIFDDVRVPSLSSAEIAELLSSDYDISEFLTDYEEVTADESPSLRERLPFERLRFGIEEASDNVFEKISGMSRGNPGVARAVFESRSWQTDDEPLDLSYDDAFALYVVVSKERVSRDVLRRVVSPDSLETSLRKLSDSGVVGFDGDKVVLRPQRFADAVSYLERRRLVW